MRIAAVMMLVFMISSGCALSGEKQSHKQGPVLLTKKPAKQPFWCRKTESYFKKGNAYYFIGETGISRNEGMAKKKSMSSAFSRVSNFFGVKVDSSMVSEEREVNGEYTYDIGVKSKVTGSPITVKDYTVKDLYIERWNTAGGEEYRVKVLLAVPAEEIARMKKAVDGLCGWYIITADDFASFTADLRTHVKKVAGLRNLSLTPDSVSFSESEELTVDTIAGKSETAYFLTVDVSSGGTEEIDGEWYTTVTVKVEYISLLDNKVVSTWTATAKGAAFSGEDALKNGMEKAFAQIREKVGS